MEGRQNFNLGIVYYMSNGLTFEIRHNFGHNCTKFFDPVRIFFDNFFFKISLKSVKNCHNRPSLCAEK